MNKSILATAAVVAAAVAVPVAAQVMAPPAPPAPSSAPGMERPMMNDRVPTRAEVVARTQRMFAMLDSNRDGALDAAELAATGDKAGDRHDGDRAGIGGGERMPLDRNAMFDMIDANHNGAIDRDEFARAPMPHHDGMAGGGGKHGMGGGDGGHGGGMGRMLAMADANRDGRVTLQEATDLATRRFDMTDTNHDGQVTPEERAAGRVQMKAMRGQQ